MNCAFVLVTTAWLAGADAAPAMAPPVTTPPSAGAVYAPPPVVSTGSCCGGATGSCAGGGCSSCSDGCHDSCDTGSGKRGLFGRVRGMFSRGGKHDGCDTCAPACPPPCPAPVCAPVCKPVMVAPSCGCDDGCHEEKQGLFKRLFGRFRKSKDGDCGCDSCAPACGGCSTCGTPSFGGSGIYVPGYPAPIMTTPSEKIGPPKEAPKTMPTKIGAAIVPSNVTPVVAPRVEVEGPKNPFDLDRRYAGRAEHAADYSAVTGQLFYAHTDGGFWVVRYASLDQEDVYGGSVVLARDQAMEDYREGDLVTVHGTVLEKRASRFLGGPLYRATSVQLVEHLQQ